MNKRNTFLKTLPMYLIVLAGIIVVVFLLNPNSKKAIPSPMQTISEFAERISELFGLGKKEPVWSSLYDEPDENDDSAEKFIALYENDGYGYYWWYLHNETEGYRVKIMDLLIAGYTMEGEEDPQRMAKEISENATLYISYEAGSTGYKYWYLCNDVKGVRVRINALLEAAKTMDDT